MKKITLALISGLLIFSIISCGSKETPEEPVTPEPPVIETPVEEPEPEPEVIEEPEVVEEPEPEPEPEIIEEVIVKVDNTVALGTVDFAREKVIESGADKAAPELFNAIEELYAKIQAKSDEGADVSAECEALAKRYEALAIYVSAKNAKDTIDDTKMFNLAQGVYNDGCKALDDTAAMLMDENANAQTILETATLASTKLNAVLVVIYKQVARDAREDSKDAKYKADSVKAAVAQKQKYDEAVALFKNADTLYSMQSHKKATENYKAAEEIFMELYDDISAKRAAVQKAIEDAKKKVAESADFALAADEEAPLKEKVAGIEDEDTVLLEADNYANPDEAEAEIPEELEEPSLLEQIQGVGVIVTDGLEDTSAAIEDMFASFGNVMEGK